MIITIVICGFLGGLAYKVVPKKFKITTSLSLQTQYFHVPMVSGFLPEVFDSQELKSQRESLIYRSLNHEFLSKLAWKYHFKDEAKKNSPESYRLSLWRKRFEVIPQGASAFLVGFIANDPEQGYLVMKDFIEHLRTIMERERRSNLLNLHDAIQDQLESLSIGKQTHGLNPIFSSRPDLVQHRIEKVTNEIETLKSEFSERHPRIAELKQQLHLLSRWVSPHQGESAPSHGSDPFAGITVEPSSKELFDDLLKKFRYLEVVLYMDQKGKTPHLVQLSEPYVPESPTWPKLPILLTWGMAAGFLIGSLRILIWDPK